MKKRTPIGSILLTVFFAALCLVWLLPIIAVAVNSFKTNAAINLDAFALPTVETFAGLANYIIGSAVAGALTAAFRCASPAPHGGLCVAAVNSHPLLYIYSVFAGALIGCVIHSLRKKGSSGIVMVEKAVNLL